MTGIRLVYHTELNKTSCCGNVVVTGRIASKHLAWIVQLYPPGVVHKAHLYCHVIRGSLGPCESATPFFPKWNLD